MSSTKTMLCMGTRGMAVYRAKSNTITNLTLAGVLSRCIVTAARTLTTADGGFCAEFIPIGQAAIEQSSVEKPAKQEHTAAP